jgi:hypothetical protein
MRVGLYGYEFDNLGISRYLMILFTAGKKDYFQGQRRREFLEAVCTGEFCMCLLVACFMASVL